MGARKDFLAKLFKDMDKDGSGSLSITEVKEAMMKMGVHLSMSKFKRLFRLMDMTRSGSISYPDFHKLIFPEDEVKEKAQANLLAMKSHASKKKQFLLKEQNLYNDTFEGQFHSYLADQEKEKMTRAHEARTAGARTQQMQEQSRINRIKSGRLDQIKTDQQQAKRVERQKSMSIRESNHKLTL